MFNRSRPSARWLRCQNHRFWWIRRRTLAASLAPVLDLDVFESGKVLHVGRNQDELIHSSNRGDLPVHIRRRPRKPLKPRTLAAVPMGCALVVCKHGKRGEDDVSQVVLERSPPFATRKKVASVSHFVPHRGRDGALVPAGFQTLHDLRIRCCRYRRRHYTGVQQISNRHSTTFRPVSVSRAAAKYPSSSPTSCNACAARNR
jgi:hypothetical protein